MNTTVVAQTMMKLPLFPLVCKKAKNEFRVS